MAHEEKNTEEGFSLMKMLGQGASDLYEACATGVNAVTEAVTEAPDKFKEGWEDGGLIDTEVFKSKQEQATETKTTSSDDDEQTGQQRAVKTF